MQEYRTWQTFLVMRGLGISEHMRPAQPHVIVVPRVGPPWTPRIVIIVDQAVNVTDAATVAVTFAVVVVVVTVIIAVAVIVVMGHWLMTRYTHWVEALETEMSTQGIFSCHCEVFCHIRFVRFE